MQTSEHSKTYANKNNAKRAALKILPEDRFIVRPVEGGFAFFPVIKGVDFGSAAAPGSNATPAKKAAPAKKAPAAKKTSVTTKPASAATAEARDVVTPALEAIAQADEALAQNVKANIEAHEALTMAGNALRNPFDNGAAVEAAARLAVQTNGRSNRIKDDDEPAEPARAAAARTPSEPRQYKISKDRPEANGIKRPSPGTKCGDVWDMCDILAKVHGGTDKVRPEHLKEWVAADVARNLNNAMIELYQWRRHNGVFGRIAKPAK